MYNLLSCPEEISEQNAVSCLQREYIIRRHDSTIRYIGSYDFSDCVGVYIRNEYDDCLFAHVDFSLAKLTNINWLGLLLALGGGKFYAKIFVQKSPNDTHTSRQTEGSVINCLRQLQVTMLSVPIDTEDYVVDCTNGAVIRAKAPDIKQNLLLRKAKLLDNYFTNERYAVPVLFLALDTRNNSSYYPLFSQNFMEDVIQVEFSGRYLEDKYFFGYLIQFNPDLFQYLFCAPEIVAEYKPALLAARKYFESLLEKAYRGYNLSQLEQKSLHILASLNDPKPIASFRHAYRQLVERQSHH